MASKRAPLGGADSPKADGTRARTPAETREEARTGHGHGNSTLASTSRTSDHNNNHNNNNNRGRRDSFESLPLAASRLGVLSYAASQNFSSPTPVQAAAIPLLLRQDAAVQAVTGSGKTLAFLISIVEHLLRHRRLPPHSMSASPPSARQGGSSRTRVHSIVLSPTRELAQQTFAVARDLFASCSSGPSDGGDVPLPPPLLLTGSGGTTGAPSTRGTAANKSVRPVTLDLKTFQREGNDVLIGTPGRVNDFISYQTVVDCGDLEYLILDEADVMFENRALAATLSSILSRLPKQKRVGLFSATTSSASLQEWMARVGMRNPVWVDVSVVANRSDGTEDCGEGEGGSEDRTVIDRGAERGALQRTPTTLKNYYLTTRIDEKLSRLLAFLHDHRSEKIIVFFLTCACVEFFGGALQRLLSEDGPSVELLHGRLVQKRREKALDRFRSCRNGVLAATDVAARGLDVSQCQIHWVVMLDAPQDPSVFVHRVGRTARAGREGNSLIFLTPKEEAFVELLRMRQVPISPLPDTERCCPPTLPPDEGSPASRKSTGRALRSTVINGRLTDALPLVRDLVLRDRDLLEKGTKAFTSYVRAYKEHRCAFIFRYVVLSTSCAVWGGGTTRNGRGGQRVGMTESGFQNGPDVMSLGSMQSYAERLQDEDSSVTRIIISGLSDAWAIFPVIIDVVHESAGTQCPNIARSLARLAFSRFQSLDLGLLATSFALLRLPKMPELRDRLVQCRAEKGTKQGGAKGHGRWYLPNFEPAGPEVDIFAIPYLDPEREEARQKRLQEFRGRDRPSVARATEKRHPGEGMGPAVPEHLSRKRPDNVSKVSSEKKRGRNARIVEEWDDLAREERLYKKLRRKKITKEQLESELYGDNGNDEI